MFARPSFPHGPADRSAHRSGIFIPGRGPIESGVTVASLPARFHFSASCGPKSRVRCSAFRGEYQGDLSRLCNAVPAFSCRAAFPNWHCGLLCNAFRTRTRTNCATSLRWTTCELYKATSGKSASSEVTLRIATSKLLWIIPKAIPATGPLCPRRMRPRHMR